MGLGFRVVIRWFGVIDGSTLFFEGVSTNHEP